MRRQRSVPLVVMGAPWARVGGDGPPKTPDASREALWTHKIADARKKRRRRVDFTQRGSGSEENGVTDAPGGEGLVSGGEESRAARVRFAPVVASGGVEGPIAPDGRC